MSNLVERSLSGEDVREPWATEFVSDEEILAAYQKHNVWKLHKGIYLCLFIPQTSAPKQIKCKTLKQVKSPLIVARHF